MEKIKKAGCILLDVKNKRIGLTYREKQNDFSFPKGHLEEGETIEECATRETEEEIGRKCRILPSQKLSKISYIDSNGDDTETQLFLAIDEGKSSKKFDKELIHKLVWQEIETVEQTLTYNDLKTIWNEAKNIIYQNILI